ncbi:uncharacterized protein LOC132937924 isoform X2 [Metopolophium dirhodum]|nr:uncharacterized protein LOC132937924 isoform X2 [Metopolophium dirhodum]
MRPKQIVDNIVVWHFTNRVRYVQTCVNIFLRPVSGYNNIIIMSEKDIARQVLRGYIDREIDLENQLKEILNRRKTVVVEEGDFFKIRREQMEKQKKIAKKRNETFLKDLEHATAKLRASLACDDLTDKKLDNERKKIYRLCQTDTARTICLIPSRKLFLTCRL